MKAGEDVVSASKSGEGCADSHPGLCAGVQVQGHCGIKEYSKACPLSCHMCAMPAKFRMQNTHERANKDKEERAGKVAAQAAKEKDEKATGKAKENYRKGRSKLELARHKVEAKVKKIEALKQKRVNLAGSSEKQAKHAKKAAQQAKAIMKSSKERLKKDDKKPKMAKISNVGVEVAKSREKEMTFQAKQAKKEAEESDKRAKKQAETLKKLEKKQAEGAGARDKVRRARQEIDQKKVEQVVDKAAAEHTSVVEQKKAKAAAKRLK